MNNTTHTTIEREDSRMDALLTSQTRTTVHLEYGIVLGNDDGRFLVRTEAGIGHAILAASCLLQPGEGDHVLLSSGEASFILAVLQREAVTDPAQLRFPNGARLHADTGDLELTSNEDVSVAAGKTVQLNSEELTLHADKGTAVFDRFDFFGKLLRSQVGHLKTAADSVDSFIRDLTAKLVWSRRQVEEMDEVQAGSRHVVVEEQLTTHAGDVTTIAESNMKLDADQIHLG